MENTPREKGFEAILVSMSLPMRPRAVAKPRCPKFQGYVGRQEVLHGNLGAATGKINAPAFCGRIEGEFWRVIHDLADSQL